MAKKNDKKEAGEQLDLIDVAPKDAKPIIDAARVYKKHQKARQAALKKETEQKVLILELISKANLQRLKDGKIKFEFDDVYICISPQDDKITVNEKK